MPELPEVRAQAERLGRVFVSRRLERFEALTFTALKTAVPDPSSAVGQELDEVDARGKYLRLRFDALTFVVHLMQGGRIEPDERRSAKPRGGLARWHFEDGPAILLTEAGREHRAGVWAVAGDTEDQPPLDGLGPDADQVGVSELARLLGATSARLHTFLRDQRQLAGLGRRLANEICHRAQLSPFASTTKLAPDDVVRLHHAIAHAVAESLAFEATQDHMVGSAERPARVHQRTGRNCPVCGDTIREVSYASYTVNYCPTCQTGGRVLADNTTSKFLK